MTCNGQDECLSTIDYGEVTIATPMIWDIKNQNGFLDFAAPRGIPDGRYDIYYDHSWIDFVGKVQSDRGAASGVEVRDGHFVPFQTTHAIRCALAKANNLDVQQFINGEVILWHISIREITWDPEQAQFRVRLKSILASV